MTGMLTAWMAEAGIVTWRAFHRDHRPPLPSEYIATFVIFGALGLLTEVPNGSAPAAAIGWGLVLATGLSYFDPEHPFGASAAGIANRQRQEQRHPAGPGFGGGGATGTF